MVERVTFFSLWCQRYGAHIFVFVVVRIGRCHHITHIQVVAFAFHCESVFLKYSSKGRIIHSIDDISTRIGCLAIAPACKLITRIGCSLYGNFGTIFVHIGHWGDFAHIPIVHIGNDAIRRFAEVGRKRSILHRFDRIVAYRFGIAIAPTIEFIASFGFCLHRYGTQIEILRRRCRFYTTHAIIVRFDRYLVLGGSKLGLK